MLNDWTDKLPKWALALISTSALALIGVLGAGNIYFVSGLVDEVRYTRDLTWQTRQDVAVLKQAFDDLKNGGIAWKRTFKKRSHYHKNSTTLFWRSKL